MMKNCILIDTHKCKSGIVNIFQYFRIPVKVRLLPVGDYIIGNIGIERKTCSDFVSSITQKDKRLWRQLYDLKNNFAKPILILEHSKLYPNINLRAIRNAIITIVISYRIPILNSNSIQDTVNILKYIYDRYYNSSHKPFNLHTNKSKLSLREQQEYVVSSLEGIGPKTARNLLTTFGSVEKVMTAPKEELMQVSGVGSKIVNKIKEVITKNYNSWNTEEKTCKNEKS